MSVRKFVDEPTTDNLLTYVKSKDDWIYVAKHFEIEYVCPIKKGDLTALVIRQLVRQGVIPEDALTLIEDVENASEESQTSQPKPLNPEPRDSIGAAKQFLGKSREEVERAEREHQIRQSERERAEQEYQSWRFEREGARRFSYIGDQYLSHQRQQQYELEKPEEREKALAEERKSIAEKRLLVEAEERKLALELELEKLRQQNPESQRNRQSFYDAVREREFDVSRNVRLLPKFEEDDPEAFFLQFEKLAATLQWPRDYWSILIQTVLVGKARNVYVALTEEECRDYDKVKDTVLKAYELVTENYRFKFRNYVKRDDMTYVEFANEKKRLCDRWMKSANVSDFASLKDLVLVEEFKRKIPFEIKLYLDEREITTLSRAAVLADNYSLTHKPKLKVNSNSKLIDGRGTRNFSFNSYQHKPTYDKTVQQSTDSFDKNITCTYCHNVGHHISKCKHRMCFKSDYYDSSWKKPKSNNQPSASQSKWGDTKTKGSLNIQTVKPKLEDKDKEGSPRGIVSHVTSSHESVFAPFITEGTVSVDEESQPYGVTILRDTGASQSMVLRGVMPLGDQCYTGKEVLLKDLSSSKPYPLVNIYLRSEYETGPVEVGVKDEEFPVRGVTFLLGNDLAGDIVVPNPVVVKTPTQENNTKDIESEHPNIFPSCVVTRAQSRQEAVDKKEQGDETLGLENCFSEEPVTIENIPITLNNLKDAQNKDESLRTLFSRVGSGDEKGMGYYVDNGVLMRKYRPSEVSASEEWATVHQVVIPTPYRHTVLDLAHNHLGGHLGLKKTLCKVLQHFYWPTVRRDTAAYVRSCRVCQLAGKPNQKIPAAPLHPIPAMGEPFTKVVIDCVGPLPKTKRGNMYLFTIMDSTTRYPEAIPLRNITSKTIVKELVKFFTRVGIPKAIQSDQGTNFTSNLFSKAMQELGVQQYLATAYHPQSQGCLERFHQTLKSMLTKYCMEEDKDWDTGIDLLLFAIRDSKQESLGYSPFELVYGHQVRGPLQVLKETWTTQGSVSSPICVRSLKERLKTVTKIAKDNLEQAQYDMKREYDKKTKEREFKVGDQVLVFLPKPQASLQSKFFGPYTVKQKLSDLNYLIQTPDQGRKMRKVHINNLKLYHSARPTSPTLMISADNSNQDNPEGDYAPEITPSLTNSEILNNLEEKLVHLTTIQQSQIANLLIKFPPLCSDRMGICRMVEHDVDLLEGTRPIKQAPYRVGPVRREKLQRAVQFLLDHGLAEPSDSEWASPCLTTPKSDGTDRFLTDYRKVNEVTKTDSYPLPRIDDIIDSVGGAQYVTKIDLMKGYYQVRLTDHAKEISAFVTPDGLYQYKVMPFGMKNAPATFQRLVNSVIRGLVGVYAYIDDILVVGKTWREHLDRLMELFGRLNEAGLTINLAKSEFGKATVLYLGHVVGQGQTRPCNAKVEAIQNFPAPQNRKELRRFLGMAGFFRKFCPNFSTLATPLTSLLSPTHRYKWTEECQTACDNIKTLLSKEPVLRSPDFGQPFTLQTDASDVGVGAVLLQPDPDGILHPLCYHSAKLKKHQKSYSTIEKECLSLLSALEKFSFFLYDTPYPINVYSDHNPLVFLNRMKNTNQRLMRWSLALQPYTLVIKHIQGKDNLIADALSR